MHYLLKSALLLLALSTSAFAQSPAPSAPPGKVAEAVMGVGDVVRITVFQNPDLTVDNGRISETGAINFPLLGSVALSGLTIPAGEQKIAKLLRDGGFVLRPQVTISLSQVRSSVVSVLGMVSKPGRYPIDVVGTKVSEMIALTGGVVPGGADVVTLVGTRQGKAIKLDIDLPTILQAGKSELDLAVENGDVLYVDRAPVAYIYGEVQRPGQFRIERGMTLRQALAFSGGLTQRGTERGMKVHRRDANGNVVVSDIKLGDLIVRDDVIYVNESLF